MNDRSIPSTHAERKITNLSDQHSFTPHPSLSPYRQTELQRDKYTHCAWAGGPFFHLGYYVSFLALAGNRFWCYLLKYLEYNTVVALCLFFGSGGK